MPKRTDLRKVLIIGSGPIVIGQACEFDYSGTQACKALRTEGYEVVRVNSNPATIMTDPEFADRTYVEPLTADYLEAIIARERPEALLPTVGGQTALNLSVELAERGVLDRYNVQLIGASLAAIKMAEDRLWFKNAMGRVGLDVPRSMLVNNVDSALQAADNFGFPLIVRPSFTLGGTGSGISYNREEFEESVRWGLQLSPVGEVLVEESVLGWKEFELEVMRDCADNAVVVCSIENFDPMGIHTGDSITVAPIQTLTDKEYQRMRDAAFQVIREIGVETGGSNIQFAVHPDNGRMVVIEMNPRVSRSSALASKATGFPIAKIAAKLAVGYALDEIKNDITRETPACFEPTIDYCVVKVQRFTFEKFPQADATLTTRMKSVGEAMAIGRTFKEALQKALRSLEIKRFGLCGDGANKDVDAETLRLKLAIPNAERIFYLAQAFQDGMPIDEVFELTKIDRWFLRNVQQIVEEANRLRSSTGILPVGQAGVSPAERENASSGRDPQFHPMDRHGEIQKHRRNLPHWEQPDATYFVTFRLADAVPQGILRRWKEEIEAWRKFHPEPWDASTKYEYQKRFQDDREQWLDQGHGKCVLEKADAAAIVVSALRHFDRDRYLLDAFVVMPNHVHVLVQLAKGQALADILHSWKSFSAKAINELLGRKGQLWQDESYDRIVRDWNELVGYRDYILHNPEKAKLREDKFVLEAQRVLHPASDSAGGTPAGPTGKMPVPQLLRAKKLGLSDRQLAVANVASADASRTKQQLSR